MTERAAPLPDQAARDLIVSRLDLNLLVEAGAGSGKTYSLAERMAAGIVSGRYQVEHMAAVTFTRKAAAELRGRFQLALEPRLATEAEADARRRIRPGAARTSSGCSPARFTPSARTSCASARSRPAGAGFTELDELDDAEDARARVARLPGARARAGIARRCAS